MSLTPDQVTVVVTAANHSHAGKPVAKGDTLHTDKRTAAHLVNTLKVGVYAGGAVTTTKSTKKEPRA